MVKHMARTIRRE